MDAKTLRSTLPVTLLELTVPRELDLNKELGRLRASAPEAANILYVRIPAASLLRVVEIAVDKDVNVTTQIREIINTWLSAVSSGAIVTLSPSINRNLDFVASSLGTDRNGLVRQIVEEHVNSYFEKARDRLQDRKTIEAELETKKPKKT
jgi:hypothetical protein